MDMAKVIIDGVSSFSAQTTASLSSLMDKIIKKSATASQAETDNTHVVSIDKNEDMPDTA